MDSRSESPQHNIDQVSEKMIWNGEKKDFVKLIETLRVNNLLYLNPNKFQQICQFFRWNDGEMIPRKLKELNNNLNRKNGTYNISEKMEKIICEIESKTDKEVKGS